jgi:acetaldehyde dehydrogenase
MSKTRVAVIGSGNIGTDLMLKILRTSESLELAALVGIDPTSDGLARAARLGIPALSTGAAGLLELPDSADLAVIFDATSAAAHQRNAHILRDHPAQLVDLTPAAIGPYVVPPVNLDQHLGARNLNMVTCGGQATIPIVAAISAVTPVRYAEIVASISSRSAGPGTRANIDEFTETTSRAIEVVGGAEHGKAIIVLNPAEPPMSMRDTVIAIVDDADRDAVTRSVVSMVADVHEYVPGYRLKQDVQFRPIDASSFEWDLMPGRHRGPGWVITVFLEVEGAGHYLPTYAGNLDIMTSAALRVGERLCDAVPAR